MQNFSNSPALAQKHTHPKFGFLVSLLLIMGIVLSACGQKEEGNTKNNETSEKVSLQLSWTHSVVSSPFYLAKEKGYYAGQNIDVQIIEGGINTAGEFIVPIDEVISGNAQFGIVDGANLLQARQQGIPVVAIAATVQRHPLALVSLKDKGITRPSDLVGKTVDLTYSSIPNFNALLNSEGIDSSTVNVQDRTDLTVQSLLAGDVDVIDGWMVTEVAELLASGQEINMIIPSDYGIEVYAEVIFTTEDMIENNPELVQRFLDASLQGLQSTVDNPNAAVDVYMTYEDVRGENVETSAMHQLLPLMLPAESFPGEMTEDIWGYTQEMMVAQQLLDAPLADLGSAYTTQFLNNATGQ